MPCLSDELDPELWKSSIESDGFFLCPPPPGVSVRLIGAFCYSVLLLDAR